MLAALVVPERQQVLGHIGRWLAIRGPCRQVVVELRVAETPRIGEGGAGVLRIGPRQRS